MKKIYLLFACLLFSVFSIAQQKVTLNQPQDALMKLENNNDTYVSPINNFKGDGEVFWTETFNWANPDDIKGWTLPDGWELGEEGEDFGHYWMWRDDTIGGEFSDISPRTWFETVEDGFIVLPMDEYNSVDGVVTSNDANSWFQTPKIDCSDKPSVVISLEQYFRTCCGSREMNLLVTNDDGVHWAQYDLIFGTATNDNTKTEGRNVKINISNVAAGMSDVQIRIHWHGNGSDHYYWIIDDMKLSEAYHNELKMENRWAWFNDADPETTFNSEGFLPYIPISQLGVNNFGEYSFQAAAVNAGIDDQSGSHLSVDVLKNGTSVFNDISPLREIMTIERDTFWTENTFLADDYGDYEINWDIVSDNVDQVPENNSDSYMFTVNDSVYSRSDDTAETSQSTGGWTGGNNTGDFLGVEYTITQETEVNSITTYIWGSNEITASCQFFLFKFDTEEDDWIEVISSEMVELDSTTLKNHWLTLPFEKDGESEFIEPGEYIVAIQMWKGDEDETFRIGYDNTTYCPTQKTLMKFVEDEDWSTNAAKLNMIRLNLAQSGGPSVAPVTFNVDMSESITNSLFNPAADFVDVTGTFNDWSGSEALTDNDGDGIYTLEIPDLSTGAKIEYKYRINASDLTSEMNNRSYKIRYWNIINNSYIYDSSIGIENQDIANNLTVYPNPTSGEINLIVNNSKQSDLTIELRDVQGQLVYTNKVISVLNHREVIDINIAKGMYFLSVNNGIDINVKKVIVQ